MKDERLANEVGHSPYAASEEGVSPLIWVVDDDPDDHYLIKQALSESCFGIKLRSFEDGEAFIKALQDSDEVPNLVILDLNMPRMNGLEVLCYLKKTLSSTFPVWVLTTSSDERQQLSASDAGAYGVHTKPLNYSLLKSLLKDMISRIV